MPRPRLLFISPQFLFPANTGGRIRTTNVLRGLKGGHFEVTLLSPLPEPGSESYTEALARVCDRFAGWSVARRRLSYPVQRAMQLLDPLPVSVASDRSAAGASLIADELGRAPDLVVVDFPHTAVLLPPRLLAPSVLFTHNVEAEIFARHESVAAHPLRRALWRSQKRKMERFEREALQRFDAIVAVSERDHQHFKTRYGVDGVSVIPTGVDLEYYGYRAPRPGRRGDPQTLVFTGAMDWLPNVDGISYYMDAIWPIVQQARPEVRMLVVGRNPPRSLVELARKRHLPWHFTGFVDDVRPFVHDSDVFVIPLRVGGGTRIKAYEAMAMGCPVVSTSIGVEGLPVVTGRDYENADTPDAFAQAAIRLLADEERRVDLARNARRYVEEHYSAKRVAEVFESICVDALKRSRGTERRSGGGGAADEAITPIRAGTAR